MTQKRRLELIWNSKCPQDAVFGAAENLGELQTAFLTLLLGVPKVGRAVHLGFIHQRDASEPSRINPLGLLDLTGNATLLSPMSDEASGGRKGLVEKRKPDFSKFPRYP